MSQISVLVNPQLSLYSFLDSNVMFEFNNWKLYGFFCDMILLLSLFFKVM